MLLWYIDETMLSQTVVGQLNVPLMNFYKTNKDDSNSKAQLDVFDLDVINHNKVVGNITFKMNYHILNT